MKLFQANSNTDIRTNLYTLNHTLFTALSYHHFTTLKYNCFTTLKYKRGEVNPYKPYMNTRITTSP